MDTELYKYILTFISAAAFNGAVLWLALRNSKQGDSKSMSELQDVAAKAIDAQAEAMKARDQAVEALEEYKRMRVADFEIIIVFSLHPTPQIKDVTIRTLPEQKKNKITPEIKMVEEDTKPLFKSKGLARK